LESELVSGFMTEHAAVIFVFFFLAEYASIVLMCIFTSILFLGGYLIEIPAIGFYNLFDYLYYPYHEIIRGDYISTIDNYNANLNSYNKGLLNNTWFSGLLSSLILGIKSSIMVFVFIWVRASFPRIRFDQLMGFCWTILLPILFGLIVLVPCILHSFGIFLININLF